MSALKHVTYLICNIVIQCNRESARMFYLLHIIWYLRTVKGLSQLSWPKQQQVFHTFIVSQVCSVGWGFQWKIVSSHQCSVVSLRIDMGIQSLLSVALAFSGKFRLYRTLEKWFLSHKSCFDLSKLTGQITEHQHWNHGIKSVIPQFITIWEN